MKSIEKPLCRRRPLGCGPWLWLVAVSTTSSTDEPIRWLSTRDACERLGVTLRTLYRFIDEGQLPAYKMGRVIRLQAADVTRFIERMRITPGTLEHLYPEPKGHERGVGGESTHADLLDAEIAGDQAVGGPGE
jgi:excisionase family DNA binding protein